MNKFGVLSIAAGTFHACNNMESINTVKITTLNDAYNNPTFGYSKINALFLPKVSNAGKQIGAYATNLRCIDIGPSCTIFTTAQPLYAIGTRKCIVICRSITPPSHAGWMTNNRPLRVFVPSDVLTDYKSASGWSGESSVTYEIGGTQWAADFGSTDEYADVMMYAPEDEIDAYITAYEEQG